MCQCHEVWGKAKRVIPEDVRGGWYIPSSFLTKWVRQDAGYLIYECPNPECTFSAKATMVSGQPRLFHWDDQPT